MINYFSFSVLFTSRLAVKYSALVSSVLFLFLASYALILSIVDTKYTHCVSWIPNTNIMCNPTIVIGTNYILCIVERRSYYSIYNLCYKDIIAASPEEILIAS